MTDTDGGVPLYPWADPNALALPFAYEPPEVNFTLRRFANFAESTLARILGQTDTVMYIQAGDVSRMPPIDSTAGEFFSLTLFDDRLAPEIVYVTEVLPSGALTVMRGMENTGSREWLPETKVRNTSTALTWEEVYGNITQFDAFAQWVFAQQLIAEQERCKIEGEVAYLRQRLDEAFGDDLLGPFGASESGESGSGSGGATSGVDGGQLIDGTVTLDKLADVVQAALMRPGDILVTGSPVRPSDFHVLAEGQLFEEAKYPELFAAYGTAYNLPSDPPGTFRLPDYRHCYLVGSSTTVGQHVVRGGEPLFGEFIKAIGDYFGFERHILTVPEKPAHVMTGIVTGNASADIDIVTPGLGFGGAFFVELGGSAGIVLGGVAAGSPVINIPIINPLVERVSVQAILNTQMRIDVDSEGQNVPHNNLPPAAVVNYWVFLGREEDLG